MLERVEKIELLDVSKLTVNDRVIITVDVERMPLHKAQEHLEAVREVMRKAIPEPISILIKPSHIDISVEKV